ncbi:hypothetical protein R6Q59_009866 [Mikania micrantha]
MVIAVVIGGVVGTVLKKQAEAREEAANASLTYRQAEHSQVLPDGNVSLGINNASSVRLSSKRTFSRGLFVFKINDVPIACDRTPSIRLSSTPHYPAPNEITIFKTNGYTGDKFFNVRTAEECPFATLAQPDTVSVSHTSRDNVTSTDLCRTSVESIGRTWTRPYTVIVELSPKSVKGWWWRIWRYPRAETRQIDTDTIDLTMWVDLNMFFPSYACDI